MERGDVERLFQVLVVEQALRERCETNGQGFTNGMPLIQWWCGRVQNADLFVNTRLH
jgi:hypothetical protein